jgi:hypothetical protein
MIMKTIRHSARAWSGLALLLGASLACHALDVKTLGGGPTQRSLARAGYANGPTLTDAKFNQPYGLAIELDGTLVVADRNNNRLRKISVPGNDASLTAALGTTRLRSPVGVATGRGGLLYSVNHGDGTVRVHHPDGRLLQTYTGFVKPTAIAVDSRTNIYVTQLNGRVRVMTPSGTITDVASGFRQLAGVAVVNNTTIAVSDAAQHAIYHINVLNGVVTLFTGGNGPGADDGTPAVAKFNSPAGIASAPNGRLVVADRANNRVRLVTTNGVVSTLYGGSKDEWARPYRGWEDGNESAALGREPMAVAIATNGTLFVAERYWNIIRQVTGVNLIGTSTNSGSVDTNAPVPIAPPTFSPNSGFYPMGVLITVASTVPVHYTTDSTLPTTNSPSVNLVGGVGTIHFTETRRDLRSLRLRAFDGTNSSVIVGGVAVSENQVGVPRDVVAGIGSTIVVPVVVNMRTNSEIRSIQYRIEVTPLNGGPPVLPQFRGISMTSNDFIQVAGASAPNTIGLYSAAPYSIGTTRGLVVTAIGTNANFLVQDFATAAMLVIPVDPNASEGHTYKIETLVPSATSNGFFGEVPIYPLPARTMTIANRSWLVGDVTSHAWYNAGDFGNGDLANNDVNAVFYSSHGVRAPWPFTDVFNAMDAYPAEEDGGSAEGDGLIDSFDLNVVLERALRLNPYNWVRYWTAGGLHWSDPATLPPTPVAPPPAAGAAADVPGPGSVWAREVTVGAGQLGHVIPGETYEVPVYVKVAPGCSVSGLNLRATVVPEDGAPGMGVVSFVPTLGAGNFIWANGVAPNEVLCSWLMVPAPAFSPALTGSNIVGYLRFVVPPTAALGQTYRIQFLRMSGGANMATPYQLEGVPSRFWIFSHDAHTPEVLSDEWKAFFGAGTNATVADAQADSDGDGVANGREYFEGTSPRDPASRLELAQENSGGGVTLSWLSAPLKLYTVERGPSATGPWTIVASGVAGDGHVKQVTDGTPPGGAFYRVRVQP